MTKMTMATKISNYNQTARLLQVDKILQILLFKILVASTVEALEIRKF